MKEIEKIKEKMDHCCEEMKYCLEERRVLVYYNPLFREYFTGMKSYPWGKQVIYGCPWCGRKFPVSLVDRYIELLLQEHEILYYSITGEYFNEAEDSNLPYRLQREDIPEEFKSDEWWKKRGL